MTSPNNSDPTQGQPVNQAPPVGVPASTGPAETPPIYQSYVEKFPESLHPMAVEIFKEWDGNVTQKFQDLHSQVQEYEPWKDVVQEYDPETVQQALAFAEALEANPQEVLTSLSQALGINLSGEQGVAAGQTAGSGTTGNQNTNPVVDDDLAELLNHPKIKELEGGLGTIAEILLEQRRAAEDAENQAALTAHISELKTKHGSFDEDYVVFRIAQGDDGETAVQRYRDAVNAAATQQNAPANGAPTIMSAGGGIPSTQVKPEELSSQDTKSLVANLLAAANQENK